MCILKQCEKDLRHRKDLIEKVKDLVLEGNKNFIDLSNSDKKYITSYLLLALDDPYEFLYESNDRDLLINSLINSLLSPACVIRRSELIDTIQNQAINYYSNSFNSYIEDVRKEYVSC